MQSIKYNTNRETSVSNNDLESSLHADTSPAVEIVEPAHCVLNLVKAKTSRANLGYEYSHDDGLDIGNDDDDDNDDDDSNEHHNRFLSTNCLVADNQPKADVIIEMSSGSKTPENQAIGENKKPNETDRVVANEEVDERRSNGSSESGFGTNDDELDLACREKRRRSQSKKTSTRCDDHADRPMATTTTTTTTTIGDKSNDNVEYSGNKASSSSATLSQTQQLQQQISNSDKTEIINNQLQQQQQQQQQQQPTTLQSSLNGSNKTRQSSSSLSSSFRQKQPTRSGVYELHSDDIDNILNDNSSINSSSSSASSSRYRSCFRAFIERLTRFYYSFFCCYSTTSHTSHTPFIWSWLNIFCCCCPLLGGISLYLTHHSKKLKLKQKYELAEKYSNYAEKLNVASLIIGVILYAIGFFMITLVIFIYWKHTS